MTDLFSLNRSYKNPRLKLILIVLVFFYLIYCLRIINLSTSETSNKVYNFKSPSLRKDIIDKNNKLLATSIPVASVFIRPDKIIEKSSAFSLITKVFPDLDRKKLKEDINSDKSFLWIKRGIDPETAKELHDSGIEGIELEFSYKRLYVYPELTSHLLGYTGIDNNGLAGIERYFDEFLSSENEQDQELKLSIDIDIQYIINEELNLAMKEFRAEKGVCIVADPNSGKVLGVVNKPDFDPHSQSKSNLFPTAWYGLYEIGSVFKALIAAIAMDAKTVSINDVYHIKKFNIGKHVIKDYHYHEGRQSFAEIFINSSNIGFAMIAMSTNQDVMKDYFSKLGIFKELPIELPEKVSPKYPKAKRWENASLSTISYGYGISITPMHFVQAMIPVINGGYFYPITLLEKNQNEPVKLFRNDTSDNMKKLLRLTVKSGTAKKANIEGLLVGGKTGTANKLKGRKYDDKDRISSFVAISPANKPKYLVYFLLDSPKGNKSTYGFATAGFVSVPAVGRILSRIVIVKGDLPNFDAKAEEDLYLEHKLE